jgi:hypothetical protein
MVRWSVPKNIKDPEAEREEMLDFVVNIESFMKFGLGREISIEILLNEGFENNV